MLLLISRVAFDAWGYRRVLRASASFADRISAKAALALAHVDGLTPPSINKRLCSAVFNAGSRTLCCGDERSAIPPGLGSSVMPRSRRGGRRRLG